MAMQARIKKELKAFQRASAATAGISAQLVSGDYQHWYGTINGPDDTPYQGGVFTVDIRIPDQYPFVPPKCVFNTRVWHPNISSQTGAICLDILKDAWSPAMTIRTVLLSLQALLCAPEPDDPQDAQVAEQYKSHPEAFAEQAADWTRTYATPMTVEEQMQKIAQLVDLTIPRDHARRELVKHGWDVERATAAYFDSSS